jgi:hypothetical protein
MKALKSDLAKRVLADPKASNQLRRFLASRMLEAGVENEGRRAGHVERMPGAGVIEVPTETGGTLRVKPAIVPNA